MKDAGDGHVRNFKGIAYAGENVAAERLAAKSRAHSDGGNLRRARSRGMAATSNR